MFQERLKLLREESGMMQKEVAEQIGVSERVYSFYETGRFPKNEEIIKKITECFDCTADYLLGISEFRNYEEIKKIHENTELFKQIEDPEALENMKCIFNAVTDIGQSIEGTGCTVTNCLSTVVDSIHEINSSYNSSVEGTESLISEGLQNLKFFEFKAFSTEIIDTVNESIKSMANELANKIKVNLEQDNDKEVL